MPARFLPLASLADIESLRARYLDGLSKAQDALLEVFVHQGQVHGVFVDDALKGYFVVHEGVLVEFYVVPELEARAHHLLPQFVDAMGVRSALVKTFDPMFLACALDLQSSVAVRGVLARDYTRLELPSIDRIRYTHRTASVEDLPRIAAVEQDVFTDASRLYGVVERGEMQLYERDGRIVGFGIVRRVIPSRPDVELGIALDAAFRNKGYAVYMLRDMVDHCVARGLNPISGCARTNEASIRLGIRIGFTSRYRLLEVRFREPEVRRES